LTASKTLGSFGPSLYILMQ